MRRARSARCPSWSSDMPPLAFRTWQPGALMVAGIWNIPVPADGIDTQPDIVVSPVVGFDRACYRLGYGGDSMIGRLRPSLACRR